ncbi:MAG: glucose-1-phosphate adenylyltransferase [Acutalibacteraceae bacterium]|nr:glucose-1-phosphate adenylyltransferase [Acutalibacteraceae bacterium]
MNLKTECVAMLLAGGQGSRLGALTKDVAKPAIPFGGKYRIIDFPLSNCVNSGIDTVGVLTQYQPLELNDYIGSGQPWDLDRMYGGVHILPPYQKIKGADWYKGTANAIYQNLSFIERYNPKYVLILSGDHIYKMDYSKMIEFHEKTGADCTISVLEVSMEEATRFGIMNTNPDNSVYEFEEKPKHPKSNKASMGIYVFTWDQLRKYLIEDEQNKESENDFGKNIIPAMLRDGKKLMAYPFEGYWKDVGTIDSLWEANMDLLNPKIPLNLDDPQWRIYARTSAYPPHFVSADSVVQNSLISEGCTVEGELLDAVLFSGSTVEKGAIVRDSVIMPGATIKKGAVVQYAIVAENAVIGENCKVGMRPEEIEDKDSWGVTTIGPNLHLDDNTTVECKAMLSV